LQKEKVVSFSIKYYVLYSEYGNFRSPRIYVYIYIKLEDNLFLYSQIILQIILMTIVLLVKIQITIFNTSCITSFWNAPRDLRAVSPASEMEEIFDRKTDQKSFARQSRDVDIGTADKNDKVSKLFVRLAAPQLCENLLLSFPVTKLRYSFEFL